MIEKRLLNFAGVFMFVLGLLLIVGVFSIDSFRRGLHLLIGNFLIVLAILTLIISQEIKSKKRKYE